MYTGTARALSATGVLPGALPRLLVVKVLRAVLRVAAPPPNRQVAVPAPGEFLLRSVAAYSCLARLRVLLYSALGFAES